MAAIGIAAAAFGEASIEPKLLAESPTRKGNALNKTKNMRSRFSSGLVQLVILNAPLAFQNSISLKKPKVFTLGLRTNTTKILGFIVIDLQILQDPHPF